MFLLPLNIWETCDFDRPVPRASSVNVKPCMSMRRPLLLLLVLRNGNGVCLLLMRDLVLCVVEGMALTLA